MDTVTAIKLASDHLTSHAGHRFDVFTVEKPRSIAAAINLAKIVSKLSPLVGNLIEFSVVELLNDEKRFENLGRWVRQDPGFPDTLFVGKIEPAPGFEIKAWFPLATEITARFKDSQNRFTSDYIYVALLAWLPERVIYGKPMLVDVCVVSGSSVAKARDTHYHHPPGYLVIEPEDTTARTRNLQQTNTNGYKWQGTARQLAEAKRLVESWGPKGRNYSPKPAYQSQLRQLIARFPYRLDTNFAKVDRIVHKEIERFKAKVLAMEHSGMSLARWSEILSGDDEAAIKGALATNLGI